MKRPTRRTILKVMLLLAAGAAANVAVAWGCVIPKAYLTVSMLDPAPMNRSEWKFFQRREPNVQQSDLIVFERHTTFGRAESLFWFPGDWDPAKKQPNVVSWSRWGWPMFSMQATVSNEPRSIEEKNRIRLADQQRETFFDQRTGQLYTYIISGRLMAFPSKPLSIGFAVNTLFYAGVLWVLCCGPFALRRTIRRRRGQCPTCGYLVWGGGRGAGASPVCTECGALLPLPPGEGRGEGGRACGSPADAPSPPTPLPGGEGS